MRLKQELDIKVTEMLWGKLIEKCRIVKASFVSGRNIFKNEIV